MGPHGPPATKSATLAAKMIHDGRNESFESFVHEFGEGDVEGTVGFPQNCVFSVEYPTENGFVDVERDYNTKTFIRAAPYEKWPY